MPPYLPPVVIKPGLWNQLKILLMFSRRLQVQIQSYWKPRFLNWNGYWLTYMAFWPLSLTLYNSIKTRGEYQWKLFWVEVKSWFPIHYLLFFLKGVLAGYSQDAYQSPQKKELCLALTISFTTGEILSPTFYAKTHETNFFKEILVYYQVRKPGTKMRIFWSKYN